MDENEIIILSDTDTTKSSPSPDRNFDLNNIDIDLPAFNFHGTSSPNEFNLSEIVSQTDSAYSSQIITENLEPKNNKTKRVKEKTNVQVQQKKQAVAEKRKKVQREKLLKQVQRLNKRSEKPEETVRNCRALVDEGFRERGYLESIAAVMHEHEATFSMVRNTAPYSILWERTSELQYLDEDDVIQSNRETTIENQMVVLWRWREVVDMIIGNTFRLSIADLHRRCPGKRITLLIDGMEMYFAYHKGKVKKRDCAAEYEGSVRISRMTLEEALVDIQVLYDCSSQLVEDQQVALTIYQFTKAVALIPIKQKKWEELEDVDTYVSGEKKDLVAVNKEGYGLKRLWTKQLCQFNLCSFETAEAICATYGSPQQLIEAYKKCSKAEGELLLKDIPVRRAGGLLSCARKIGPELSKKIYLMFTSTDGANTLGGA